MNGKKFIDITQPITNGMDVWPGDTDTNIERVSEPPGIVSRLTMSSHCGTHMDAPLHFDEQQRAVDEIPLSTLCGPVCVVSPAKIDHDKKEILELKPFDPTIKRLIINTGLSTRKRVEDLEFLDFYGISAGLATKLRDAGIILIGIDTPSIESLHSVQSNNCELHTILCGSGIVIVERLDLSEVGDGVYELICLPLKITGADGSPVRAMLVEN